MLKHIGRNNDRKVVVLFHTVPNEDHMCLLVYSDLLPRMIHDEIMRALESAPGQQSKNLADVLHRVPMQDGRNTLEVLHKEGFMKKVQTSQVIMTPTPASQVRLDELNTILSKMSEGEEAIKQLAEMDSRIGMQTKKRDNTGRNVGEPAKAPQASVPALQAGINDVLTDEQIATQQLAQATRMKMEARSLIAEAERLEAESAKIAPSVVKATKTVKAKTVVTEATTKTATRKPGRPKAEKSTK